MAVNLVKGETDWTLNLGGVCDIFDVGALHAAACEAAAGSGRVVLGLHEATALDTATTQVLLALCRAMAKAGREVALEGAAPGVTASWARLGVELPGH